MGLDTDTPPSHFRALSFSKNTVTPMEKLRLRKDTTILGQSIASKGEFKDKQALKA